MNRRRPDRRDALVLAGIIIAGLLATAAIASEAHGALHRSDAVQSARAVTVATFAGFTEHPPFVTARCHVYSVHRARCRAYYAGDRIAARVRVTVVDRPGGDVGYLSSMQIVRNGPRHRRASSAAAAAARRRLSWSSSTASVYDAVGLGGATACATRSSDGRYHGGYNIVAHKTLPCGTRLRLCYRRRCASARVQDRGPYVAGRELDLDVRLQRRLGFPYGVDTVRWRIVR